MSKLILPTVDEMSVSKVLEFSDARGRLFVCGFDTLDGFAVSRLFWITSVPDGTRRGGHAHRCCNQVLVCAAGNVTLEAFDGASRRSFRLAPGDAVRIPAGIWGEQVYGSRHSVLFVLCDRPYEDEDYIRELDAFQDFRRGETAQRS